MGVEAHTLEEFDQFFRRYCDNKYGPGSEEWRDYIRLTPPTRLDYMDVCVAYAREQVQRITNTEKKED